MSVIYTIRSADMPDSTTILTIQDELTDDHFDGFVNDLELAELHPEAQHPSVLTRIQQIGVAGTKRWVMPFGAGFVSSNALFDLVSTVMRGSPDLLPKAQKIMAEFQIPAVAATYATLGALDATGVEIVKVPNRILLSSMDGLGVATFTLPMLMEILTRFIQLIEHEPRNSDVEIPDWSAALMITSCCLLGLLQAMQSDCLKRKAEHPDAKESVLTHPYMLTASAVMKSASSLHSITLAFMEMAQFLNMSQLTPQSDLEYYLRWGITLAGGAVGGYILGRPNPEQRTDARYFNYALSASQLFTLCLAFAATFYLSPTADKTYGDVVEEQTVLWVAIIPIFVTMINLVQCLWVKSPALLNRFIDDFNNYIDSIPLEPDQEEGEEMRLTSTIPPSYSTNSSASSSSYGDSDLDNELSIEDDCASEFDEQSSSTEDYSEESEEEQEESEEEQSEFLQETKENKCVSMARLIGKHSSIIRVVSPKSEPDSSDDFDYESALELKIN